MAEFAVNLLIDNLVPLLKEEMNLLRGVGGEFESIKRELEVMKPYLKNADERAERGETNDGVKALVKQIRNVSFRIEDVIDEYILHLLTQRSDQRCGFIGGGCFYKVARSIIKCKSRKKIASEIKAIKADISDINNLRNTYGLQVIEEGSSSNRNNNVRNESTWLDPRVASLFLEEAEVVGIETPRDQLNKWMAEEASSKRTVVTVVGEGGLGKTTLVKKVFDDQIACRKFVCHAWISVSQSYKIEELLRIILKQFYEPNEESPPSGIETMDQVSLIRKSREYLQEKRYVVVFDDVWDIRFWEFINLALPDDNIGSRVIITTRISVVAPTSYKNYIYTLEGLPDGKAWELFCKMAFESDYGGICPPELKQVSKEIVRKCNGVPLAIVTIGRLLSTKEKVASKWQKFLDSLGSEMKSNPQLKDVEKIILFSYLELPSHLKPCFLYFGIFPENYSIRLGRLVRLWIAEGFIKEETGKTLEEIAEKYLEELVHRSLVQVGGVRLRSNVLECRVHDIMREIILSRYKELSFCQVLPTKDNSILVDGQVRRLSIHDNMDEVMNGISITWGRIHSVFRIRCFFSFGTDKLPKSFVDTLVANFKLLKVLDFKNAQALNCLPEAVGDLLHLRYLSLRKTKVKVLPKSIGRLRCLLTLDVKYSHVHVLPIEINKLRKLRHLIGFNYYGDDNRGVKVPEGIDGLVELQKLNYVDANDDGGNLVKKLSMLRQLRKLGILNLKKEDGKDLCIAIENMTDLESLKVVAANDNILDLQDISSPPASLRRLGVRGRLEKFPVWICKLKNVVEITFWGSSLKEDPLQFLQKLPNLVHLELIEAYDGEILYFGKGGFQKLKKLSLWLMSNLISVKVEKGALPLLQHVHIGACPRLNFIRDQIDQPIFTAFWDSYQIWP